MTLSDYRFCVAPMMDGTDRHCRYFHRLLSRRARLYTEMVTADAAIHGDREYLLGFDPAEHPVALQLGGSEPKKLKEAARLGEGIGYNEINLNVGCPSDRVQAGAFGACLMKTPQLVADCVAAMRDAVSIPVTVKCRIGVDDQVPRESLFALVEKSAAAGCSVFIVHARMAWLQGLSPKDNRTIPPLDYELVRELKAANRDLTIVLNGGIESINACHDHLSKFDGVMLGRAAYSNPFLLAQVDKAFFGEHGAVPTREDIIESMSDYVKSQFGLGVRPHSVTRHMIGLYHGAPGARQWRRFLSEQGQKADANILDNALRAMQDMRSITVPA